MQQHINTIKLSLHPRVRSRPYFKKLTQRILPLGFKYDRILSF
ncbi:hypothetical protein PULV_a6001 [Pseudoalteromonas ulvae UL12]|nr:hypothetical protein [Pseudoalteromonas ulvae UL12]